MAGAVRITDLHVCAQWEGPKPHVGGPVGPNPTVTDVFLNDLPAAVVGDSAVCVGRPDRIVAGHADVTIGDIPVADATGATEHGGRIVTFSDDVQIG